MRAIYYKYMDFKNFFKRKSLTKDLATTNKKSFGQGSFSNFPSSTYISLGTPSWRNLSEQLYLLRAYCDNPIVQAIINVKADALSNIKFKVKDLRTGEIVPLEQYDADGGVLLALIQRPNPLQSTYEWIKQYKVNREVFGNAYIYASLPIGFEKNFSYKDISVLNNLPPYCVAPVLTGQWMDATEKDEIIKEYVFKWFNSRPIHLVTDHVLHLNEVNININDGYTTGRSKLVALQKPISNIDAAYESRNVLIYKRGALGILTSEKKDETMGMLPLDDDEIQKVQDAFEKYGLLDDQYSQIISPMPLKYQKMAMSVKDLMLFEEIESDAIAIAVSYGVPELLVKYYLKGGTFKNLDASEKRLYDTTIIPESKDFMVSLNSFLKTREQGIELIGSFDHLNILQINKKEEAQTIKVKEATALSAFKIGAIDYNEYLKSLELPNDDEIGSKRVWDLTDVQLIAIGIKTENNGIETTE